ncbi:MAG: hypothetical protein ACHQ49_08955 [Elusimicrobiota bacterium]
MNSVIIFLASFAILFSELTLGRALDVALTPALSWICIGGAMFGIGLAGLWMSLPLAKSKKAPTGLDFLVVFGLSLCFLPPIVNALHLQLTGPALKQVANFAVFEFFLILPFFAGGAVLIDRFSKRQDKFGTLYFIDLAGGALGCMLSLALVELTHPARLICLSGVLILALSAVEAARQRRRWLMAGVLFAAATSGYLSSADFRYQFAKVNYGKYGVKALEFSKWDRVSKIDVIETSEASRYVFYDGGAMNTEIVDFDGDFRELAAATRRFEWPIFSASVAAAHVLKSGSGARVFLIGAAGGREILASLVCGASRVDVAEMVRTVLDLGRGKYSAINGGIFLNPAVFLHATEARAFLRANPESRYDIIQMFSTVTTSSAGSGNGLFKISPLVTVEAFAEYFRHLAPDGILQINHPYFARIVTTLAEAWKIAGLDHLEKHVVVVDTFEGGIPSDRLPTILVKRSPWTAAELRTLGKIFPASDGMRVLEDPTPGAPRFLPLEFYNGGDRTRFAAVPYRVEPTTDDSPFFRYLDKDALPARADVLADTAYTRKTIGGKNNSLLSLMRTICIGLIMLLFAWSYYFSSHRPAHAEAGRIICYFSSIGLGFLFVELYFAYEFSKALAYPYLATVTILCSLLASAGVGSFFSGRIARIDSKWICAVMLPLLLILASLGAGIDRVVSFVSSSPEWSRPAWASAFMLPVGLLMGFAFPFGVRRLIVASESELGLAWFVNGCASVIGAFLAVKFSLEMGFHSLIYSGLGLYAAAWIILGTAGNY